MKFYYPHRDITVTLNWRGWALPLGIHIGDGWSLQVGPLAVHYLPYVV